MPRMEDTELCLTHYPSWGSETSRAWSRSALAAVKRSSLPLMGIGNLVSSNEVNSAPDSVSLPLMGIGNEVGCWDEYIAAAGEIVRSLPLMGIGNTPAMSAYCRRLWTAHYPSWGSETPGLSAAGRGGRATHYPSWGSETRPYAT